MRAEAFYRDFLVNACRHFPAYPEGRYRGRGIVLCAGGLTHLANAFVCMRFLREFTALPIELFYAGAAEMPAAVREALTVDFSPLVLQDITASRFQTAYPFLSVASFRGVQIKPQALLHASFEEIFYIDADNIPLQSPEPLFAAEPYRQTGALFWPDLARTRSTSETLFRIFGVTAEALKRGCEFESGQIVLDKRRCWKALLTACLANSDAEDFRAFCFHHTLGDKDTFRLAFQFAGQPYHLVGHPSLRIGNRFVHIPVPFTEQQITIQHDLGSFEATGMLQHDLAGEPLFAHKTIFAWGLYQEPRNLLYCEGRDGGIRPLPVLAEREKRGYGYLKEFKERYRAAFGRERRRELQGAATRAVIKVLDGVQFLQNRSVRRSAKAKSGPGRGMA